VSDRVLCWAYAPSTDKRMYVNSGRGMYLEVRIDVGGTRCSLSMHLYGEGERCYLPAYLGTPLYKTKCALE